MWLKTYKNGDRHGLSEIYHDDESILMQDMSKNDKILWVKYWNKKGEPVDSYEEAEQ